MSRKPADGEPDEGDERDAEGDEDGDEEPVVGPPWGEVRWTRKFQMRMAALTATRSMDHQKMPLEMSLSPRVKFSSKRKMDWREKRLRRAAGFGAWAERAYGPRWSMGSRLKFSAGEKRDEDVNGGGGDLGDEAGDLVVEPEFLGEVDADAGESGVRCEDLRPELRRRRCREGRGRSRRLRRPRRRGRCLFSSRVHR